MAAPLGGGGGAPAAPPMAVSKGRCPGLLFCGRVKYLPRPVGLRWAVAPSWCCGVGKWVVGWEMEVVREATWPQTDGVWGEAGTQCLEHAGWPRGAGGAGEGVRRENASGGGGRH